MIERIIRIKLETINDNAVKNIYTRYADLAIKLWVRVINASHSFNTLSSFQLNCFKECNM